MKIENKTLKIRDTAPESQKITEQKRENQREREREIQHQRAR